MDGRIHPEGAPGEVEQLLRAQWGDTFYEQWRTHQRASLLADTLQRSATVDATNTAAAANRARGARDDAEAELARAKAAAVHQAALLATLAVPCLLLILLVAVWR